MDHIYGWRALWVGESSKDADPGRVVFRKWRLCWVPRSLQSNIVIRGMWTEWPEPKMQAECLHNYSGSESDLELRKQRQLKCALHLAGEEPCYDPDSSDSPGCGIYMMPSPGMVFGGVTPPLSRRLYLWLTCWVRAWGIVTEYERGWRAQFVEVLRIWASPAHLRPMDISATVRALQYVRQWGPDISIQIIPPVWLIYAPDDVIPNDQLVLPSERWWQEYCTLATLDQLTGLYEMLRKKGLELDEEGYLV